MLVAAAWACLAVAVLLAGGLAWHASLPAALGPAGGVAIEGTLATSVPAAMPSGDAPRRHLQHPRLQGHRTGGATPVAWPSAWKTSISSPSRKSTGPGPGRNSTRPTSWARGSDWPGCSPRTRGYGIAATRATACSAQRPLAVLAADSPGRPRRPRLPQRRAGRPAARRPHRPRAADPSFAQQRRGTHRAASHA